MEIIQRTTRDYSILILAAALCWGPGLFYFFSQDDLILYEGCWRIWHNAQSLPEWLHTILFEPGIIDFNYRPLSTHIYFCTMRSFFGFNAFPFHFISVTIHLLTAVFIGAIAKRLGVRQNAVLLAMVFYVTRDALFGSVEWISGIQDGLAAFFSAVCLWAALRYYDERGWKLLILMNSTMILALLSKEIAIVLPIIINAILIIRFKTDNRPQIEIYKKIEFLLWSWLILIGFIAIRLLLVGANMTKYPIGIFLGTPINFVLYTFWGFFGIDFRGSHLYHLYYMSLAAGFLFGVFFLIFFFLVIIKKRRDLAIALITGLLLWLIPVCFLCLQRGRDRVNMYYLSIPLLGTSLIIAVFYEWINKIFKVRHTAVILLVFVVAIGATSNQLKRFGLLASGSYYNPHMSRHYQQLYTELKTMAHLFEQIDHVYFYQFLDPAMVTSNPDGKGYRNASPLESLIHIITGTTRYDVHYVVDFPSCKRPTALMPYNVISLRDFECSKIDKKSLILFVTSEKEIKRWTLPHFLSHQFPVKLIYRMASEM
ncbi:MAG: hypothetical protein NT096_04675 [Proteobacteria bacterium]|nr:hypothetical protein [Pseudomonadota bacterium]